MSAVTPLAPQRAARIATQLVELIEIQNLKPNDRLPSERTLAELLAVSRPSLREALHILQAQGLVQIKHGQGTFVQEPIVAQELRASMMATTHGLNELFDAREVRDTSLKVPHGESGKVIGVKIFESEEGFELAAGVNQLVRVYVAQKRKIHPK